MSKTVQRGRRVPSWNFTDIPHTLYRTVVFVEAFIDPKDILKIDTIPKTSPNKHEDKQIEAHYTCTDLKTQNETMLKHETQIPVHNTLTRF